ncbi:protein cramped-like isoform X2 [Ptychodera flava]|uniref:protein cramped-like isoform X2 n=1 Tax=Ptychodera flava TaxID=63121 RepID=UPI003969C949
MTRPCRVDRMTTAVSEPAAENRDNKSACSGVSTENGVPEVETKRKRGAGETTKEREENIPQYKHPVLRSSVRPHKRYKKDQSPPPAQPKEPEKPVKAEPQAVKKRWEAWTVQDKNYFFEALFEHGKDFEAIQKYMEARHKKRGDPHHLIKNKDQVRHLYYRTWHKISKYITPNEDMKKTSQELYGLVNYGELRKKAGGGLNDKIGQKLNELATKGRTIVRHKGKNLRVKTPVCKSLKRLNCTEGTEEDEPIKLPAKIVVELQPHTNAAWATIQSMAQNPRIRITAPLKREVGSLISFLQEKWTPSRLKLLRSLRPFLTDEPGALLCVKTPENVEIVTLSQLKGRYLHSNSKTPFSFGNSDCSKCGKGAGLSGSPRNAGKNRTQNARGGKAASNSAKGNTKDAGTDGKGVGAGSEKLCENCRKSRGGNIASSSAKGKEKVNKDSCVHTANKMDKADVSNHRRKNCSVNCDPAGKQADAHCDGTLVQNNAASATASDAAMTGTAAKMNNDSDANACANGNKGSSENCEEGAAVGEMADSETKSTELSFEDNLRQGITVKNCEKVTFTELYVMLGMPEKIKFEYDWKKEDPKPESSDESESKPRDGGAPVQVASGATTTEEDSVVKTPEKEKTVPAQEKDKAVAAEEKDNNDSAVKTLGRLIQLANTELIDITKPKQSAGSSTSPSRSSSSGLTATTPSKSNTGSAKNTGNSKSPKETSKTALKVQAAKATGSKAQTQMPANTATIVVDGRTANSVALRNVDKDKGLFVRPTMVPALKKISPTMQEKAFMAQLQTINKQPNRKRTRGRKPLVVQRMLLPRPSSQVPTRHMMSLSIVPNSSSAGTGSFTPVLPSQLDAASTMGSTSSSSSPLCSNLRSIVPTTACNTTLTTTTINPANTVAIAAKLAGVPGQGSPPVGSQVAISNGGSPVPGSSVMGIPGNVSQNTRNVTHAGAMLTEQGGAVQPGATLTNIQVSPDKAFMSSSPANATMNTNTIVSSGSPTKSMPLSSVLTINTSTASTVSDATNPLLVSPPNISSLLDISLPAPDGGMLTTTNSEVDATESLIDMAISSSGIHSFDGQISTTVSTPHTTAGHMFLTTPPSPKDRAGTSPISPSTSPFKLLTAPEHQWLNGERDDISFSSILAGIESPEKKDRSNQSSSNSSSNGLQLPPLGLSECSRDSLMAKHAADVDTTLQYMMNENSVDYISKFADLAAQISATPETPKKQTFDLNRATEEESNKDVSSVVKNLEKL